MSYRFRLSPKQGTKPNHHPFIAFDVETNEAGDFLAGALYGEYRASHRNNAQRICFYTTDLDELVEKIKDISDKGGEKNLSTRIVGYNISYDLNCIEFNYPVPVITKRLEQKGRFISARFFRLPVYDLTNFFDGSLLNVVRDCDLLREERWAELKEREKEDQGVHNFSAEELEYLNKYDVFYTWLLATKLEDFLVYELKVPLSYTVGMVALNLYRYRFMKESWARNVPDINLMERKAYYGGRTELFRRPHPDEKIYQYDINSMYVSIMRDCLIPNPNVYSIIHDQSDWDRTKPYIIHARIKHNDSFIGYLPYHREDGKLIFPIGEFEGWWCSPEFEFALEHGMIEVIDFKEAIIYHKQDYYFRDFALEVWHKRQEYKQKGERFMEIMIKKIGNSLYGKFAQRNGGGKWVLINELGEVEDMELRQKKYDNRIYVYVKEEERESSHSFPVVAAFITSNARLMLLKAILEIQDSIIYCDTDSLHARMELHTKIPTGKDLGKFKFEGIMDHQIYYRPKFYGGKAKGVPKNAKIIEDTSEYRVYEFKKPIKRSEGIVRDIKPNSWVKIQKLVKKTDDKRIWLNEYESRPIVLS